MFLFYKIRGTLKGGKREMPQGMDNFFKLMSPAVTLFFYRRMPAIYFNNIARDEVILHKKFVGLSVDKENRRIEFRFCDSNSENFFKINNWQNNSRVVLIPTHFFKNMGVSPNKKRAFILHRNGSRFSNTPAFFINY